MGHALVNTLQDILIRWARMSGFEALWVPGTDHAGIATQTVVERHLFKTSGKSRRDFSREEFLQHVWKWKEENEFRIIGQLKKMGCSCDWTRQRFTMDDGNNRAVRQTFKMLYDAGLIYRGDYLVNWDPVAQTALADDEVEYEEQQGSLWHIKYPLSDGSGFATVATTRPETMLGDTAVAVSPKDERYRHLVGKTIRLPLVNREIPIIADPFVDPQFGTGMVKVTPAHDPNDYEMGHRHKLPFINVMTPDGRINENGGAFKGLAREEARAAVVKALKDQGLLVKVEPHTLRVGVSYRSKAIIEPYMSKQWFVKMETFRPQLRDAVASGKVELIPKSWENSYFHWIDNLRDWCISRQLWWGHRIPIWYHKQDKERIICYAGDGLPPEVAAHPEEWSQDEDVLDTWFSSQLWPFAALGWPERTPDLEKFYPNAVLVTGHDILFFWVARMILMGQYVMGQMPFPQVFLHGLIYGKSYWRQNPQGGITYVTEQERLDYDMGKQTPKDVESKWEKMSKSKGNIIDPLEIIAQYGTDAMRMALCSSATQGRQIDLDRRRFEEFKNFANKVWNGARFVFMNLNGDPKQGTTELTGEEFGKGLNEALLKLEDRWLLSVLNRTNQEVNRYLKEYAFDQAASRAYEFFWKEFCAYYLEIAKPVLFGKQGTPEERANKQKLLVIALCHAMRLIHPMAPFITEELFQKLKQRMGDIPVAASADPYTKEAAQALACPACIVAPYPQVIRQQDINSAVDKTFDLMGRLVYTIRNIRGEMQVPPGTSTDVYIVGGDHNHTYSQIAENRGIISALVKTNRVELTQEEPKLSFACTGMTDSYKVVIPLPQELIEKETVRLKKEADKLQLSIGKLRGQLDNKDFVEKAPSHLVEQLQKQLRDAEGQLGVVLTKIGSG
jgi:valyl-tRNA synthetase